MRALRSWLDDHPREAPVVVGAALVLALLITTQLVFPGDPSPARGTPVAVVVRGFIFGFVASLYAVGIVLVYRTMRFVNFAQGAFGVVGMTLLTYMVVFTPVPFPIALLLGVAASVVLGVVAGTFLLRFFSTSRLFMTIVSILGSTFMFVSVLPWIVRLPFWPRPEEVIGAEADRLTDLAGQLPFQGFSFTIGSFAVPFGIEHVVALELAAFALIGVVCFLRYTRAGAAVRAMADNPERAALLGISVSTLSVMVWGIAAGLDAVASISVALGGRELLAQGLQGGQFSYAILQIPLTAAVLARFERIGTAVFASTIIGVARAAFLFSYNDLAGLFDAFLLAVVAGSLLLQRRAGRRSDLGAQVSWAAAEEPRRIPAELRAIRSLTAARYALSAVGILLIVVYPFIFDTRRVVLGGVIFITAIAVLSLVVLTGWAGQVSLGQWALVAVGAVVAGKLSASIPFWFAVPVAIAATAGVAVVVGLPALRLKGLMLLVMTFAFALTVQSVLFEERWFGWLLPDVVERPTLLFFDFEDEKSMYFLSAAGLVLTILVVRNLRRSRVGRLLIAVRENEANLQAFGIDVVRAKLLAFAIAGGIAGFAGSLYAAHQHGVSQASFSANQSVNVFIQGVLGGVSSSGGALLGSTYFQLTQEFATSNLALQTILNGAGPLVILFLAPGGLISLVNQARDSVLRIIAQRRRIVVPSLFADFDPDAAERQLIPLGESSQMGGLSAVGDRRYTRPSDLYAGSGRRITDRLAGEKVSSERSAFAAAAHAADDAELRREIEDANAATAGVGTAGAEP
ncbi:MAG: ABC transporter permease subunit [Microthrixaceae bacterium]